MRTPLIFAVLSVLVVASTTYSDQRLEGHPVNGVVRGRVVDSEQGFPVQYVNALLYETRDSSLVTGTITDENGNFTLTGLAPGIYHLRLEFMGYERVTLPDIGISRKRREVDLGTISLERKVIILEGAEVVEERPQVEFRIDRKVINVEKQYTAVSGTAVDVLQNVPSVTVDVDGSVKLRGSSNFTVLIDDRLSVLEPAEALQQIPATSIESIEIITNPSAKYDPEGKAGIINIVTRKGGTRGISGILNQNGGLDDKYGSDLLLNFSKEGTSAYAGANYNKRVYPGSAEVENESTDGEVVYVTRSEGINRRGWTTKGLRAGIEISLTRMDELGLSFRYGGRDMEFGHDMNYDEWTGPLDTHNIYRSSSLWKRKGEFFSANLDFKHSFGGKKNRLSGQLMWSDNDGDEQARDELLDTSDRITSGQRSNEVGPSKRLIARIDYTLPFGDRMRLEAGYQSRFLRSEDVNELYEYDTETETYQFQQQFSHTTRYDRDIHSIYTLCSRELGPLDIQGGIRLEYTYRTTELVGEDELFKIDRWDFFPTLHLSYGMSRLHQVMVNYTRRIRRPRGWYLEPFLTWMDAYNVRRGNPALEPEYIDSYELGYQRNFGRSLFSLETYYRMTHDVMERVRSVYEGNIMLHTYENVGRDHTFGVEFMLNHSILEWWDLNAMGNLYDFRITGELEGESYSRKSFNWNTRFNNTLSVGARTSIQVNVLYNSPTVSSQGRREGYFTVDAAVKRTFLEGNLTATLQLSDFMNTAKYERISEGPNFSYWNNNDRKAPIVVLTLSYNFNNYKPERSREEDMGESGEEEMF
ncbi:MAG: TonB-dependent receptor domain-containing protein [Candidatus Glassbacteria bacterium]